MFGDLDERSCADSAERYGEDSDTVSVVWISTSELVVFIFAWRFPAPSTKCLIVRMLPSAVRLCEDRLSLVSKALDSSQAAYKKTDKVSSRELKFSTPNRFLFIDISLECLQLHQRKKRRLEHLKCSQ